jgi:hypothetical protein
MGRFSLLSACPLVSGVAWNHQRHTPAVQTGGPCGHARGQPARQAGPQGLLWRISVGGRRLRGALFAAVVTVARSIAPTVVTEPWTIAPAIATLEAVTSEPATAARSAIAITSTTVTWFASALGEGEQRQVPGALDRRRQRALVLGAGAGLTSGLDHPTVGDEAAHPRDILVIDVLDAIDTESTDLAARERATTTSTATKPARGTRVAT